VATLYAIDVAARPLGRAYGGKHGVSVACPLCNRPALIFKKGKTQGRAWVDYAHRLSFELNSHNEPVMHAS
jgi:hypothetical protein